MSPANCSENRLVSVQRVLVTPTQVHLCGPQAIMSNRILRQYQVHVDNFLHVLFIDEECDKTYSSSDLLSPKVAAAEDDNRRTKLYNERILKILTEGITVEDKNFDFLAYSSSQLRDNSVWMFAPTGKLNAHIIRSWMGKFSLIRDVAEYSAALGQSFSSSAGTDCVTEDEIDVIPDIEVQIGETVYNFSDGIGKISVEFAMTLAMKCGLESYTPSAFEIAYGGYKGVVVVDPSSEMKLSLRLSMWKYLTDNMVVDVLSWSKYEPCFLNRQIITLLSTLGISDDVFVKKQREAVAQLDDILVDPLRAQEALELMSSGENTMLQCGYELDGESLLPKMMQTFRESVLLDLRAKSRILVPQARRMMGCLDETGTLDYGQVFVQFSDKLVTSTTEIVKGKVVVAKNRCLHPGDVRVLEAIDVPQLHHMVDCVVFPQKGLRPHPNECSGSDLNGDVYFVCWDPDLIPTRQVEPMDYNPAPTTELDHDVTIQEVQEYFVNNIGNDRLGIIADALMVFADKEPSMALSEPCLELARLFYFNKIGITAEIPPHLRVEEYPDFMEKPDKSTYISKGIIGKIFREVKDLAPQNIYLQCNND